MFLLPLYSWALGPILAISIQNNTVMSRDYPSHHLTLGRSGHAAMLRRGSLVLSGVILRNSTLNQQVAISQRWHDPAEVMTALSLHCVSIDRLTLRYGLAVDWFMSAPALPYRLCHMRV